MAEFLINDFSTGLISSDDDVNGRKTGLLRMENVELDQNGAIVLTGGTVRLNSVYSVDAHTIFSKILAGTQYQYLADTGGAVYRNNTSIETGGSHSRAGFGSAFNFVIGCSGAKRFRDTGAAVTDLGQTASTVPTVSTNGAGLLNGDLQYIQLNVYASGAYIARSAASPVSLVTAVNNKIQVTPITPTSPANEVWICRRGGTLNRYYRVARILSSYTTPFDDNVPDYTAIQMGVIINELALPVNSTSLPDDILEVVGPINSRMLYFTANAVNFSEVNSPESYVPGQSVYFMGAASTSEIFCWAKLIGLNTVLIGTTKTVYRLTGTMIELPDGTLDIYLKPLGVDAPPLNRDAAIYQNQVVYMSAYGFVICSADGVIVPLCPPNVDVNYYGKARYGINGVPIFINGDANFRYSCAVIRNKLFSVVPELPSNAPSHRVDVYDFVRKYWRSIRYVSDAAPLMVVDQEDDTIIGYFASDKYIKRMDDQFVFTFANASTTKQTVTLRTPFYDCGLPRNRKDVGTLKFKMNSGGENVAIGLYLNGNGNIGTLLGNIAPSGMSEISINIEDFVSPCTFSSFALTIQGTVGTFRLSDISVNYEARPEQKRFHRMLPTNFGVASKKRVRTLPFMMDTQGHDVFFTPIVDGTSLTGTTFNAAIKKTFYHFFTTDVFGVDYGGQLTSDGYFELYEGIQPETVQTLPVPKRFDQVGPEELARYAKIKMIELRVLPIGGTTIPYVIYFQDATEFSGTITVVDGVEDVYPVPVPKTTSGQIVRIEYGPTSFNFHRYYTRIQATRSGTDTEMEWIILPAQG